MFTQKYTPLWGTLLLMPLLVACNGESESCRNFPEKYSAELSWSDLSYTLTREYESSWDNKSTTLRIMDNSSDGDIGQEYLYSSSENYTSESDVFGLQNYDKYVEFDYFGGIVRTTSHTRANNQLITTNIEISDLVSDISKTQWLEHDNLGRPIKGLYFLYEKSSPSPQAEEILLCSELNLSITYDDEARSILSTYDVSAATLTGSFDSRCQNRAEKSFFNDYGLTYKTEYWKNTTDSSAEPDRVHEVTYEYQEIDSVCKP